MLHLFGSCVRSLRTFPAVLDQRGMVSEEQKRLVSTGAAGKVLRPPLQMWLPQGVSSSRDNISVWCVGCNGASDRLRQCTSRPRPQGTKVGAVVTVLTLTL